MLPSVRFAAVSRPLLAPLAQACFMSSTALLFERNGEPSDVLQLHSQLQLPSLQDTDISVEILSAPINPSDINTIQGKYPLQPQLPGIPGHEGVGRVVNVGCKVSALRPGDHVVPLASAQGTWRSVGVFAADDWHKVPADLAVQSAATLCINPPTALCMLEHFVDLTPGDVVVQNGATSAVGQHVIQLATAKGVKTVNVIRDRPDWAATVAWLKGMGADVVTTEQKLKEDLAAAGLPAPKLALNCIGGSQAAAIAKVLRPGSTHVTYGAMSLQPLSPPTALLIFKDIIFRGFWISGGWVKQQGRAAHRELLDRVASYIQQGVLLPPQVKEFPLSEFKEALSFAQSGHRTQKAVFVPNKAVGGGISKTASLLQLLHYSELALTG